MLFKYWITWTLNQQDSKICLVEDKWADRINPYVDQILVIEVICSEVVPQGELSPRVPYVIKVYLFAAETAIIVVLCIPCVVPEVEFNASPGQIDKPNLFTKYLPLFDYKREFSLIQIYPRGENSFGGTIEPLFSRKYMRITAFSSQWKFS